MVSFAKIREKLTKTNMKIGMLTNEKFRSKICKTSDLWRGYKLRSFK